MVRLGHASCASETPGAARTPNAKPNSFAAFVIWPSLLLAEASNVCANFGSWHSQYSCIVCRSDSGNDALRSDRRHEDLSAQAPEGVIDGVGDGGWRSDGAALTKTLLSE